MLRYNYVDWIEVFLVLIVLILVPLATFQFWKRKKSGWILFSIILTYGCLTAFMNIIFAIHMQLSSFPGFNGVIRKMDPIAYTMTFVFYAAALWLISKQKIREIYNIERDVMFRTIGVSAGSIVLFLLVMFFK